MDDHYTGPYFINRHVGKGVYELRNSRGMVIKKKVNSNRLKVYTCSKDMEDSKVDKFKQEGECEESDQKLLLKQLDSPNLLQLWRTGASELLYNTKR